MCKPTKGGLHLQPQKALLLIPKNKTMQKSGQNDHLFSYFIVPDSILSGILHIPYFCCFTHPAEAVACWDTQCLEVMVYPEEL